MTDYRDIEEEIPLTAIPTDVIKIKKEYIDELCEDETDWKDMEVRYEIYDNIENSYNCEACGITFVSIEDHIRDYHADEDIIVKIQGNEDEERDEGEDDGQTEDEIIIDNFVDFDAAKKIKVEPPTEIYELMVNGDGEIIDDEEMYETEYLEDDEDAAQYIKNNGVHTKTSEPHSSFTAPLNESSNENEFVVDKDGRPYNRKLVKINAFWDTNEEQIDSAATIIKMEPTSVVTSPVAKKSKANKLGDYKCTQCDMQYSTARSYSAHLKLHRIELANNSAAKKISIRSDMLIERNDKFECEICHTIFASNKSLRLHSRMHDPIKPRLTDASESQPGDTVVREYFHCEICNKNYEKQFEVIHMRMHSDEPNFHCTICNKKFNSEINLEMHVKAHQELKLPPRASDESGINLPYKCSFCGRQFSRPHEKVKHERIHTGEKPHICEICGKSFRVSYCLTLHMRTHTGARPYACPYCNKRFKAHSVYNHHLMTHSDSRPYQCPFCPKAFKTSVQLAGHKNSHTKPFSCNECNRPFATLYAVRAHMETHKKPNHNLKHKCRVCGATYARSFALRDHMKEQHADIYENAEIIDADIITIADIHENTDQEILPDTQILSDSGSVLVGDASDGIIIDEFETEEVVTDWILPKK